MIFVKGSSSLKNSFCSHPPPSAAPIATIAGDMSSGEQVRLHLTQRSGIQLLPHLPSRIEIMHTRVLCGHVSFDSPPNSLKGFHCFPWLKPAILHHSLLGALAVILPHSHPRDRIVSTWVNLLVLKKKKEKEKIKLYVSELHCNYYQ